MHNKPLNYLFLGLLAGVVGCHAQGIQPLVSPSGTTVSRVAGQAGASEVAVTIRWPYRTQVLPTSAQHLGFHLAGPFPQDLDVFRPDGTSPTSVATMSVDVGNGYTLTVQAYDNAPTPRLVASGTSTAFNVLANERTNVTVALTPAFVPTITGFSPSNGGPGATVTIYGTNFGEDRGLKPDFTFNGTPVTAIYPPQEGTVSVLVPMSAVSGPIVPRVDGVSGEASDTFTVLKTIGISPASQTVASGSSVVFTAVATTSEDVPLVGPTVSWSVTAPMTGSPETNYQIQAFGDGMPETGTESVGVGTIDANGHFTATSTGSAQIVIFSGTLMATASITVTE